MRGINTLAYLASSLLKTKKHLIRLTPGANVIKLFSPSLMKRLCLSIANLSSLSDCVGDVRSLPWAGAHERFFTQSGSCFTSNRLEWLIRNKHSSLFGIFISDKEKKV
jgi:hypothetical protein